MKKELFALGVVSGVLLTGGCATVTTGTSQNIAVVTEKGVEEAKCELTDKKGRIYYVPSTPGNTSVHKGDGPMTVICKKDGYKTATIQVDESFAGATLGNIILGGGVGIVVDTMSGAAQKYPDKIIVWMEPNEWSSEEDKVAWTEAKEAYEASIEKHKKAENDQSNQATSIE